MSIVPSPRVNTVSVNCWHARALLGIFLRLFMNFKIKDGDTLVRRQQKYKRIIEIAV
jgi:hypothetical protein